MARRVSPDQFANELLLSTVRVGIEAAGVVKKAAQNVKDESRANVLRSAPVHNAGAYKAITYDEPSIAGPRISSEVGYDKDIREGRLGNLLEHGGGGDKSPAHRDIGRAADNEEPRFADAIVKMTGRLL